MSICILLNSSPCCLQSFSCSILHHHGLEHLPRIISFRAFLLLQRNKNAKCLWNPYNNQYLAFLHWYYLISGKKSFLVLYFHNSGTIFVSYSMQRLKYILSNQKHLDFMEEFDFIISHLGITDIFNKIFKEKLGFWNFPISPEIRAYYPSASWKEWNTLSSAHHIVPHEKTLVPLHKKEVLNRGQWMGISLLQWHFS